MLSLRCAEPVEETKIVLVDCTLTRVAELVEAFIFVEITRETSKITSLIVNFPRNFDSGKESFYTFRE
jgi:hypothetical protein